MSKLQRYEMALEYVGYCPVCPVSDKIESQRDELLSEVERLMEEVALLEEWREHMSPYLRGRTMYDGHPLVEITKKLDALRRERGGA